MNLWNIYLVIFGVVGICLGITFLRYPKIIGDFVRRNLHRMYGKGYRIFLWSKDSALAVRVTGWAYIAFGVFLIICGFLIPAEMM